MTGRILAIAFVAAVLTPGAMLAAQPSSGSGQNAGARAGASSAHAASSKTAVNAKKGNHPNNKPCNGNANNCHRPPNNRYPWWSNSVYVNGGSVDNYLATQPPHTPPPNKVNTGGQTFKSIGN